MKWINVAEQQPIDETVVIRHIVDKTCLCWAEIRKITPEFITYSIEEFGDDDYPSIEYEWLDESEERPIRSRKEIEEKVELLRQLYGVRNMAGIVALKWVLNE